MRLEDERECFTCEFCGNVYCPEPDDDGVRVLNERTPFDCPVCNRTLADGALGGHRVLHCPACGGILVPMGEFLELLGVLRSERGAFAASPLPLDARDLGRRICCPRCRTQMDTHPYGGPGNIVIDSCEACEVNWLDRGELARIVAAPDHQYTAAGR